MRNFILHCLFLKSLCFDEKSAVKTLRRLVEKKSNLFLIWSNLF